ncbi:MAG: hypothetical protein ACFE9Q_00530 [Candidatus Hodarchaeota archaeon]
MIQISNLYEKAKENNQSSGILFFVLVTFLLIVINPYWPGVYLYRDLEFVAGALFGMIFAMRNRKPDQPPITLGIIIGLIGGILAAVISGSVLVLIFSLSFILNPIWFFVYIGVLCTTGIIIGLLMGVIIGWYYKSKDIREKEDTTGEGFLQDLLEK